MIAPVLARLLVGGVENQLVDGLGHVVAPPSWRRFLSEGKQTRLQRIRRKPARCRRYKKRWLLGWKPALRNSSVPAQGQSRKPAFCGFSWTYRMILDSDASLRTKWSKYSRCQKPPERPKRRFARWAENDFQECRMASNLRSSSVENTTMHVIRHHTPRQHLVALPMKMPDRIGHNL